MQVGCDSSVRNMRLAKAEIGEPLCAHMGAGGLDIKHGVGILLNRNWKRQILKTEYINERTNDNNDAQGQSKESHADMRLHSHRKLMQSVKNFSGIN